LVRIQYKQVTVLKAYRDGHLQASIGRIVFNMLNNVLELES